MTVWLVALLACAALAAALFAWLWVVHARVLWLGEALMRLAGRLSALETAVEILASQVMGPKEPGAPCSPSPGGETGDEE